MPGPRPATGCPSTPPAAGGHRRRCPKAAACGTPARSGARSGGGRWRREPRRWLLVERRPEPVHEAIEDAAEASRDVLGPDDRSEEKHSADEDHDADSGDEEC